MSVIFSVSLLTVGVLIVFYSPAQPVLTADQNYLEDHIGVKSQHKRQTGDGLCYIPDPLENGLYFPHIRRCPFGVNSAPCQLVPGTPVPAGWVIRYSCNLGYQLNTPRIASICIQKPGGAKWLPPLPSCLESLYPSHFLPKKNVCGKLSRNVRTKRKIDGKISKRGAWPWMVIFGHNKTNNPRDGIHWFCAGTLITTRHVLTAANCVAAYRRRPVFIARLDDINLEDSVADGAHPIEVGIDKKNIIVNLFFKEDTVFLHNIAVVKLNSDIEINDYVRPICLPTPDFMERSFTGESVYLTTWGQTDNDQERSPKVKRRNEPILHEISAKVLDHETCKFNYRGFQSSDTPIIISDELICAAVESNKSCQGDIGSPLVLEYKDSYFLLGIVATEFRCFDLSYPRLFTKLSSYMEWIVANLKF